MLKETVIKIKKSQVAAVADNINVETILMTEKDHQEIVNNNGNQYEIHLRVFTRLFLFD